MQGQKGPSFSRSIGWTRRLHNFASPRRKLHDGATCPPPQQSGRTGRAPGFEAQTGKPACVVVLRPKPSISAWPPRDLLDVDACSVSAKPLTPPSRLTRPTPSSSVHVLLPFSAPHGSSMTPPGLLGSLSPSLLAFALHLPWFIGTNLSLNLHRIRRPLRRILRLHITSQETSNSYHVINHSSSRVDHHSSSISHLMSALTTHNTIS